MGQATIWLAGLWLAVGVAVLYLFVSRLWVSLPADPAYRGRLGRWLAVVAVGAALCAVWAMRTARARPGAPPYPSARYHVP